MKKDYSKMWDFYQSETRSYFKGAYKRFKRLSKLLRKEKIPSGSKVLDIGFGDGQLLEMLHDYGYQPYGVDFSPQNIELSEKLFRKNKKNIVVKQGDIAQLPLKNDFFEAVIASEILEHLEEETLRKGLFEIRRVLKKGQPLIVTVPYQENLLEDIVVCPKCDTRFHRFGHEQSFDQKKLFELLKQSGFQSIRIKGVNFGDHRNNVVGKMSIFLRTLLRRYKNYLVIAY